MNWRAATIFLAACCVAAPLLADEGRIPVYEPTTITEPGHYVLTRDITAASGPILDIRADGVVVSGNGHTLSLSGTAGPVVQVSADVSRRGVLLEEMVLEGGKDGLADDLAAGSVRLVLRRVTITGATDHGLVIGRLSRLTATELRVVCHGGTAVDLAGISGAATPAAELAGVFLEAERAVRIGGAQAVLRESEIRSCERAVELTGSPASLVTGSVFTSPGSDVCFQPQPEPPGIWFSGCGGSAIRGNVFRAGARGRGFEPMPFIELVDSDGVTITGNLVRGSGSAAAGNFGIAVDAASDDTLIAGNSITACGDAGIRVLSSGNAIRDNLVDRNRAAGIFVGGTNNLVERNRVGHNAGDGIWFDNDSGPHVYRDNVLRGNSGGPIGGSETNTDGGANIS